MNGFHRSLVCLGLSAAFVGLAGEATADAARPVAQRPPANAPKREFPLNVDARAVMDLRLTGQQQVAALMTQFAGTTDESTRHALMEQVQLAKRTTEIGIIRLRASQARVHGDLAQATLLDALAEAIEHPAPPAANVAQVSEKPAPAEGRQP